MKALKHLSVLHESVAMHLFFLDFQKSFSTRCRHLQVSLSNSATNLRLDFGGILQMMSRPGRSFRSQSVSESLPAGKCPPENTRLTDHGPTSQSHAHHGLAWASGRNRRCCRTHQSAPIRANIFVVMPPRGRPMARQRASVLRSDPSVGPSRLDKSS